MYVQVKIPSVIKKKNPNWKVDQVPDSASYINQQVHTAPCRSYQKGPKAVIKWGDTVVFGQTNCKVFSAIFCLVSKNLIGNRRKKGRTLCRLLRPDSSAVQRLLHGPLSPQEGLKEGIVLPRMLNERSPCSGRYQILPFYLPVRLSCASLYLNNAALQLPSCQVLSLL